MNRFWMMGGALLVGASGLALATMQLSKGQVFIAGDLPVNSMQVREKLEAEGWSDIQIRRRGRYIQATATKDAHESIIAVDSHTGRLQDAEDEDDDDDDDDD